MEAGREMDAAVAEMLGRSTPPSHEYAMAKVAWRYIASTGRTFSIRGFGEVFMPPGETLRQPEGSSDWNDRYALYIAEKLGERIAAEVDAYRLPPRPYSTDLVAAFEVVEYLGGEKREDFVHLSWMPGLKLWNCSLDSTKLGGYIQCHAEGETLPLAICRAALTAAGRAPEEGVEP